VLTLKLDERSFQRLATMRRQYFPAIRDRVPAHLTLLHQLGAIQISRLLEMRKYLLAEPLFGLEFCGLRLMGQGVAVDVRSSRLQSLRDALVAVAGGELTGQDQQRFQPHVTVQNKVPAAEARAAYAQLSAAFLPWRGAGRGVLVWRYLGGPWGLEHELPSANT
jgi:2'-5' RNA ligase